MKSIGSIFVGLMLITVIFYSMQGVGNQSLTNDNIDNKSILLILDYNKNLDDNLNYNTSFEEFNSTLVNVSNNETDNFDSVDVFAREYLERTSDSNQKTGVVSRITKIPDLIILSLGVPQSDVAWIRNIILIIIGVALSFAAYRAFFGGGKLTNN